MPIKPELNVSGYRGIWGETLTKEIAGNFAKAFAEFTKEKTGKKNPTILIGRDGRESGPMIKDVILRELKKVGVKTIYGDIMPTPTVLFSVRKHGYDGAIIITASHNPIEYNGLKFVNNKALFTIKDEVEKINEYNDNLQKNTILKSLGNRDGDVQKKFSTENFCAFKKSIFYKLFIRTPNFTKEHADHICANVNIKLIRAKKFKIVVDMINASACAIDPYLFKKLGVKLIPLNNIPNGKFAHRPEPVRENLTDIMKTAKDLHADLGFVHDPDADRLVIINEKGEVVSEEYSLAFGVENILSKNKGKPIVINLSTSQMNVDIAKKYSGICHHSKIGEGHVVDKMLLNNAIIGGEGNGGIIYPKINTARDSFTGIALVLELLAERNQTISEVIETFPRYFMKKDKWKITTNLDELYSKLKIHYKNAKINEEDGLRLDFEDNTWIHIRPSNTEPIIRLYGEANEETRIDSIFKETKLTLGL